MRRVKNKVKKTQKVVRKWKVYNEAEELIFETESSKELLEKFEMKSNVNLYSLKNTKEYFRPNIRSKFKIRVDYVKEKIIEETIEPFVIPLEDRDEGYSEVENSETGEIWRHVPDTPYCNVCSNLGRFGYIDSEGNFRLGNVVTNTNANGREYENVHICNPDTGKGFDVRLSRVIAKTFIDPSLPLCYTKGDKKVVDHKNNKPKDNRIENLRIVSSSENITLAIYEQGSVTSKPCKKCYAIKDGVYKEYDSTVRLVQDITGKRNSGYFNSAMKRGKPLYGYEIGYIDEE